MKFVSRLLMMMVLFATSSSFAVEAQVLPVKTLVDQFYQQKEARKALPKFFSNKLQNTPPRYCPPSGPSCVDVACEKLGRYNCDDLSEIQNVGAACRGNYDGSCLAATCQRLGKYNCDDMSEIQSVTRACVGNYDASCFESVCNRLGKYNCDDMSEIEEVLRSCAGN